MKQIKSYTSVWNVENMLYALNDIKLPFPVSFTQMAWFLGSLFVIVTLGKMPPLSMVDNVFIKYGCIPIGVTWFMSQKSFDGKNPYRFLKSAAAYFLRPKVTYAGKAVKNRSMVFKETMTAVRSVVYDPDKIPD